MKGLRHIALFGIGILVISQVRANLRAAKKIDVQVSGERVGMSYQGVPVELSYVIKNPTKARIELSPPLVRIRVGEKQLASSTITTEGIPQANRSSNGRIVIAPFSQTEKIRLKIQIPFASLLPLGLEIFNAFKSDSDSVKIQVETTAQVYTSIGNYPFDDLQTIEL